LKENAPTFNIASNLLCKISEPTKSKIKIKIITAINEKVEMIAKSVNKPKATRPRPLR
jgi:hypothetical protein